MGNNPSTSHKQAHAGHAKPNDLATRREPKRRESVHAYSATSSKATPAPPSASLESAVGQHASSPGQARDITPAHSRPATVTTPHLRPEDQLEKVMGNDNSKPKRSTSTSRSASARTPPTAPPAIKTAAIAPQPHTPVDDSEPVFDTSPLDSAPPPSDVYSLPAAAYSRPPRLPLPIDDESHLPGSPILSAIDEQDGLPQVDSLESEPDTGIHRRTSVVSSNQDDDEDMEDYPSTQDPNAPKTKYLVEWRDAKPGDKVYVTGTFTNWERKFRLHSNGPSKLPNALSTWLQLPAGTHHLKFLVNNDMSTAPHLPTTVDYANILVNYVEISADALPQPVAVPALPSKPLDIRNKQATETSSPAKTTSPVPRTTTNSSPSQTPARSSPRHAKTPPVKKAAPKHYTNEIPQYLLDLDSYMQPSESPGSSPDMTSWSNKWQRANAVAATAPTPPSLPSFLGKSILNAATPRNDDASVLTLPNHTVINHLATTNIKLGILATSSTTRYKTRFLTTILYKPQDGD